MRSILGTKIGMTSLFETSGKLIPVSVIHCEPNVVLELKTIEKHNSSGAKVGYLSKQEKSFNKAELGIFKKINVTPRQHIRTLKNLNGYNVGDEINVNIFEKGEYVDIQGTTKGHGFTGAIFRWNKKIGPLSHGAGYPHRYQGSIAFGRGGSEAQRVTKGKKMAGHYGHETITTQNLVIVDVDKNNNLIIVTGAIPGPVGSVVKISESVKKPGKKKIYEIITKEIQQKIFVNNEKLEDKEALHKEQEKSEKKENKK